MPRFLGPTQGMPGMFDYQMPDGSVTPLPINPQQAQALAQAPMPDEALRPPMAPPPPSATVPTPGPAAQQVVPQIQVPEQPQGAPPAAVPSGLTRMFQDKVNRRRERFAAADQAFSGLGQIGAQLSAGGGGSPVDGGLFELLRRQQMGIGGPAGRGGF